MKKIKIGQIGIGHNHGAAKAADCKRLPELFEFVGVVAPDVDEYYFDRKNLDVYKDVPFMTEEELFAIPDLDAVIIETSVPHLVPTAQRAIDRGLHIHLDKPAGENIAEFEKLLMDAKAKKLAVQMGYMYRYNPGVLYALEQIEAGRLGSIHTIDAHMSTEHMPDFRTFLSQFKGGSMYIFGCHLIDLIFNVAGTPDEIIPVNHHSDFIMEGVLDNTFALLKYPKFVATVRVNSTEVNGHDRRQFVICGRQGSVEIKPLEPPEMTFSDRRMTGTEAYKHIKAVIPMPKITGRYDVMVNDLYEYIMGTKENPYTYEYELQLQKLVLAACGFDIDFKTPIEL